MKKLLLNIFLALFCFAGFAQQPWIPDYNRTYYKIKVADDGIYRIPYSTLTANGIPVNQVQGSNFQLYFRGEEIPVHITTTGTLGSNDYIEFYGQRNDGKPDSLLYADPDWQPNPHYSLFTDTSIYYLTWNNATDNERFQPVVNESPGSLTPEAYCLYEVLQYGTTFWYGQANAQVYDAAFNSGEGYISWDFSNGSPASVNLATPNPYASGPDAVLSTRIIGKSSGSHNVNINVGINSHNTTFSGYDVQKVKFYFPANQLSTSTPFNFTANGGADDADAIGFLHLTYPHTFNFENRSNFKFALSAAAGGKRHFQISNFNDLDTTVILYDFTTNSRIESQEVSGTIDFVIPAASVKRDLYVYSAADNNVRTVGSMEAARFTNLFDPYNQGNFIIISHSSLHDNGSGINYVEEYKNYRNSTGYTAQVVDIDELYDQFTFGIAKNPLAIQQLAFFAMDNWQIQPEYFFLIGKGMTYNNYRNNSTYWQMTKIPAFGFSGAISDNLLTAAVGSVAPRVAIGRLSASGPEDIENYLNKVQEHESNNLLPQTIADKAWMKNVLHLVGGVTDTEKNELEGYMNRYTNIIKDTLYGANVVIFKKKSNDPVELAESDYLKQLINDGTSLITFFGHSSTSTTDYDLGEPTSYDNQGKYPFMYINGCLIGNIFGGGTGISEKFIFAEDRGAIGFLGLSGLGYGKYLNKLATEVYKNISFKNYNSSIGKSIQKSIANLNYSPNDSESFVPQQLILHGDPAIKVNPHPKADYVLEEEQVTTSPSLVSIDNETFDLNINAYNIGKAVSDTIIISAVREFPTGTKSVISDTIPGTRYKDFVSLTIPTNTDYAAGLNKFTVTIDAGYAVDEISEINNTIEFSLFITSKDAKPVYPYEFSIVSESDITLKASTVDAFAPVQSYIIQIDTAADYSSALKRETTISQGGGFLEWKPSIPYIDSTVYYWRISKAPGQGEDYSWQTSSFIYIDGSPPGWNQSHFFQFEKDEFNHIIMDSAERLFKFAEDAHSLSITNYSWMQDNGELVFVGQDGGLIGNRDKCLETRYGGPVSGITFIVINSTTGEKWVNDYCEGIMPGRRYLFGFGFDESQEIKDFLDSIPCGHYVIGYAHLTGYNLHKGAYGVNLISEYWQPEGVLDALAGIGLSDVYNLRDSLPYAFFIEKCNSSSAIEAVGNSYTDTLEINTSFTVRWHEGTITSTKIGPAKEWNNLFWDQHALEDPTKDAFRMDVIGLDYNNNETVLYPNIPLTNNFDLSGIDAAQYPFLKLKAYHWDDSTRTPPQIDYWRVLYQDVPEMAVAPNKHFFCNIATSGDTLHQGQKLDVAIAYENIGMLDMDSVLLRFYSVNAANAYQRIYQRKQPLSPADTLHAVRHFNITLDSFPGGMNTLFIEANPINPATGKPDQLEQYKFNNIAMFQFYVYQDKENPLLDVTFDGAHIMDGDIVSAEPNILINLKDENKYLALDDTSLIKIKLKHPDGDIVTIPNNDPIVTFIPADPSKLNKENKATIELNPTFTEDGTYELIVEAEDKTKNESGDLTYRVSFEVINKPMVSNVMNYPNPFTSSTRFVFTLTGVRPPDYFKVQIMTISGKVVREITQNELGPLRIGYNITDYAWDGTDEYGDPLANGLYLYRIIANIDGKPLEHYSNNELSKTDKIYFTSGFGKMYLMR